MKKLFILTGIFSFVLFFSQTIGKVIAIKDGDTVVVLLEGNTKKTLRLAEVDCPESGQPFGKNAKEFTSSKVFGKEVMFEETDTDRYGRTIAKIYYDSDLKYLSAELIKAGLGWWYFRYSNDKNLGFLESKAKADLKGLWQDPKAISPWDWRKLEKK